MKDKQTQYYGMTFFDGLTLIFITLKLCGIINWSWLWVLSPILIPLGIVALAIVILTINHLITKNKNE